MKNYSQLKGLIAAAFTPMDAAGKVNLSIIKSYAKLMIDTGLAGIFPCGTTGEFSSLTTDERKQIAAAWVGHAKGKLKVIVHVGGNCQQQSIELAQHASEIGADGIAAIAPCFFKPQTTSDLIDFFVPVAAAAKEIPFYYYNMPAMTGVDLSVTEFLHEGKKRIPNLAGVKYTHNNLMEMAECLHLDNKAFEVLHGYDEILITGIVLGAVAGVGSTYNYIPEIYTGIMEAMEKEDIQTARALQLKSIEIVKIIIKYGGGVRGGKAIMKLMGIDCGLCRLPIKAFTDEEYKQLDNDLKQISFFQNKK